jgi:hypothetical protein
MVILSLDYDKDFGGYKVVWSEDGKSKENKTLHSTSSLNEAVGVLWLALSKLPEAKISEDSLTRRLIKKDFEGEG